MLKLACGFIYIFIYIHRRRPEPLPYRVIYIHTHTQRRGPSPCFRARLIHYTYTYTYAHTHTPQTQARAPAFLARHIHTHTYIHTYTHTDVHIHTYIRTHTRTQTQARARARGARGHHPRNCAAADTQKGVSQADAQAYSHDHAWGHDCWACAAHYIRDCAIRGVRDDGERANLPAAGDRHAPALHILSSSACAKQLVSDDAWSLTAVLQ